jgi:hypothetical protein
MVSTPGINSPAFGRTGNRVSLSSIGPAEQGA